MNEHRGTLGPGATLEEFRIERVLGQGGFGVTYLAHDTCLEQQVAIKEYLPRDLAVREGERAVAPRSTLDEPAFRQGLQRFLMEARTLARLRHPSIVRVLRYFEGLGTAYMVMEYERGANLAEALGQMSAPPDEAWVRRFLEPLLEALAAVHAADFLHRDIKPDNIFLRHDGTPVLLDFGAARSPHLAAGGLTSIYTPGYAPLEQYSSDGKQGPWTDIYGMAATLYRVTTGKRPPAAPLRSRADPMEPATRLVEARYAPRLLRAIDWGLRVDEATRPQSVAEWRTGRGEEAGLGTDVDDATPTAPLPVPVPRPRPVPRMRTRWLTTAAIVLAVAGLAAVVSMRTPRPSERPLPLVDDVRPPTHDVPPPAEVHSDTAIGVLGMVDATDDGYEKDPDLLLRDLRADARRQALEKAVGIFVERAAFVDQYESLEREVLGRGELVEQLVDDARPRQGKDGLAYLPASAEVRVRDVRKMVYRLAREQRVALIRTQGDPLVSVTVAIRDAERGSPVERSALAENVIKLRIRDFGFRVASPGGVPGATEPLPDFAIESEAKLKRLRHRLAASGITIEKYVLTSWTVKCTERATGEEIYFDNRLPESGSWADEDVALREIGTLVADAFSRDFFAQHLKRTSRRNDLIVRGVPSDEVADLLRLELVALQPVVQVAARPGGRDSVTFALGWYDQGPGGDQSFDGTVLAPLRRKLGRDCLRLEDGTGDGDIGIRLAPECAREIRTRLETLPAAALSEAPPGRLAFLARTRATMRQLALLNPDGVSALAAGGLPLAKDALRAPPDAQVEL